MPRPSLVAFILSLAAAAAGQPSNNVGLRLSIAAAPSLAPIAAQLQRFDTNRLAPVIMLVGRSTADLPIDVQLVPESSPVALRTPRWVAGFAEASRDLIVLFPERVGSYPFGSIETVLYHEITHVLIDRATNGAAIPRWFHEGLASAAERTRGLEEHSRLTWELLVGGAFTATELELRFRGDHASIASAYVLSDALVRDLLQRHGWTAPSRILTRVRAGEPFEVALLHVTGVTVAELIGGFRNRHATWKRWVAVLGNPFTLWMGMTGLALVAIWRHRRRRVARRLEWERQEREEALAWEERQRRHTAH